MVDFKLLIFNHEPQQDYILYHSPHNLTYIMCMYNRYINNFTKQLSLLLCKIYSNIVYFIIFHSLSKITGYDTLLWFHKTTMSCGLQVKISSLKFLFLTIITLQLLGLCTIKEIHTFLIHTFPIHILWLTTKNKYL